MGSASSPSGPSASSSFLAQPQVRAADKVLQTLILNIPRPWRDLLRRHHRESAGHGSAAGAGAAGQQHAGSPAASSAYSDEQDDVVDIIERHYALQSGFNRSAAAAAAAASPSGGVDGSGGGVSTATRGRSPGPSFAGVAGAVTGAGPGEEAVLLQHRRPCSTGTRRLCCLKCGGGLPVVGEGRGAQAQAVSSPLATLTSTMVALMLYSGRCL